jgi:hypothetical protein
VRSVRRCQPQCGQVSAVATGNYNIGFMLQVWGLPEQDVTKLELTMVQPLSRATDVLDCNGRFEPFQLIAMARS